MPSYQPTCLAHSAFVDVRMYRYHVRLWGDAQGPKPPLVLVHGWMDVAASWQFMVDAFTPEFLQGRQVIAPDWRGFGHTSGPPADHYAFVDYLGDLDALLGRLAPARPVILAGHSMGGHVAMLYAGVRPERIHRLVNLEGFGVPATESAQAPGRLRQWLDEIGTLHGEHPQLRSYADEKEVAQRLMKTNPRLAPGKARWLARQWAQPRATADGQVRWHILGDAAHRVVSAHLARVEEVLALYREISAPTLVVEASENHLHRWHGQRFTLAQFHERLQAVQQLERVVLPDCAHMLHHDQPALLARTIEDFAGQDQSA